MYMTSGCTTHKELEVKAPSPTIFKSFNVPDPGEARGCSTNTSVIHSVMVCENISMAPPHPYG